MIHLIEQNPFGAPRVSARIAAFRAAGDEIAVCDAARLECLVGPYYYLGNKEGHIPTRSASEGPMKSSESRRGSPLDD